jgi:putative nucleotidyltransferase with HDIG domain
MSGEYWVGFRGPVQLEAHLGTCVGLAVFDDTAGVGGLIHILLPEPPTPTSTYQLEKYAVTGLPVFLKALRDKGGDPRRMKAGLAGGALIGPVAQHDLNLDIGGRISEIAVAFLARKGIDLVQFEIGGFLPTRLRLDMTSGRFTIVPTGSDVMGEAQPLPAPRPSDIQAAMQGLQPIPQVALRILRLVAEEDYRVDALARLVRQDQVISARTLQLCNAASLAPPNKITSVERALVYLGRNLFTQSVVAVCVQDFYHQQNSGYSLQMGGLFQHAVGTATIAEHLARRSRHFPSLAYTGGLLHDIGKVVLDQFVAARRPLFYRDLASETNFLAAEKQRLGIGHTEVGRRLAEAWQLPRAYVETIAHHHFPEQAEDHQHLVHLVYLADLLMSRFHTGLELERINTEHLSLRLSRIGLSSGELQSIVDSLPARVFRLSLAGAGEA